MIKAASVKIMAGTLLVAGIISACAYRFELTERPRQIEGLNPTWMEDNKEILSAVPLNKLLLLGSHDSASYGIHKGSHAASGYLTHTGHHITRKASEKDVGSAVCQDVDLTKQLEYGIRHLDLRIAWQDNRYWAMHMWLAEPAFGEDGIFRQIREFSQKHPYEIILLRLEQVYSDYAPMNPSEGSALFAEIEKELPGMLIAKQDLSTLTCGKIWTGKPRIILFAHSSAIDESNDDPLVWTAESYVDSPWMNQDESDDLAEMLDEQIAKWRAKPDGKLHCLQSMTTTKHKISDAFNYTNPEIKTMLEGKWQDAPINIVQVDDAVYSGLMPVMLKKVKELKPASP